MSLFDFDVIDQDYTLNANKDGYRNERDWAQIAEIDVTDALNGFQKSDSIEKIARAIKTRSANRYSDQLVKGAMWIGGNDYRNAGDIKLNLTDRSVSIEMKFSKESGRGTAKNPSTLIFTRHVSGDILSYQHYDEQLGYRRKRFDLIEKITGSRPENDAQYGRQLRRLRISQPDVLTQIEQITTPGQVEYAQMTALKLNDHLDAVNRMIRQEILHVDSSSKELWYCVVKNFETVNQTVEFIEFTNDNTVTRVVSQGKTIKFQNRSGKDVVRFSVHWKNICQGGQTPCFNVFIGNVY